LDVVGFMDVYGLVYFIDDFAHKSYDKFRLIIILHVYLALKMFSLHTVSSVEASCNAVEIILYSNPNVMHISDFS